MEIKILILVIKDTPSFKETEKKYMMPKKEPTTVDMLNEEDELPEDPWQTCSRTVV